MEPEMKARLNKIFFLNLNLELKPEYSVEDFCYYLSSTLAYFVEPIDVANFKEQYLSNYLLSEKPLDSDDTHEWLN